MIYRKQTPDSKTHDAALEQVRIDCEAALSSPDHRRPTLKALDALDAGAVYRDISGACYCESSERDGVAYLVTATSCSCPSRRTCWHRYARRALCLYEKYTADLAALDAEDDEAPLNYEHPAGYALH